MIIAYWKGLNTLVIFIRLLVIKYEYSYNKIKIYISNLFLARKNIPPIKKHAPPEKTYPLKKPATIEVMNES